MNSDKINDVSRKNEKTNLKAYPKIRGWIFQFSLLFSELRDRELLNLLHRFQRKKIL